MGKIFWIGMGFAVVGIVLMSLPDRGCTDCGDEVTDVVIYDENVEIKEGRLPTEVTDD